VYALLAVAGGVAAAVTVLLVATAGAGQPQATTIGVSATPVTSQAVGSSQAVVDVGSLPQATTSAKTKTSTRKALPFLSPLGATGLKQAKANAAANAPFASEILAGAPAPATPSGGALQSFEGLKDSPTVCSYFGGGCEPPDHGIAANDKYVVQVVNTSILFITLKKGKMKAASLQSFFKVPAPSPAGCDPDSGNQPFLSDPRIAYDPDTGRWFAAVLQVENGFGLSPSCTFASRYWVAVSKSSNPTKKWTIYAFDTGNIFGGNTNAADYTQLGFDSEAIFIGGNQFDAADPFAYRGAWTLAIPKATAEAGGFIGSITGFGGYTASDGTATRTLDTVQPVVSLGDGSGGPAGEILISSFNESITESKVVLFDFSNALGAPNVGTCDSSHQCLSGVILSGLDSYSQPPLADDYPLCTNCLETIDNRISATPVYMHGNVYFTHDTALNNGSFVNANVQWGIVRPVLDQTAIVGCTVCSQITADTSLVDNGYLTHSGSTDTWFGVIQPDREGNVFIAYEYGSTSGAVSPSSAFISRRATATDFPDGGVFLRVATNETFNSRWGDYEAASFAGWDSNQIWFATEYSDTTFDWGTHIDRVNYSTLSEK
jgi:hypothetical protein